MLRGIRVFLASTAAEMRDDRTARLFHDAVNLVHEDADGADQVGWGAYVDPPLTYSECCTWFAMAERALRIAQERGSAIAVELQQARQRVATLQTQLDEHIELLRTRRHLHCRAFAAVHSHEQADDSYVPLGTSSGTVVIESAVVEVPPKRRRRTSETPSAQDEQ